MCPKGYNTDILYCAMRDVEDAVPYIQPNRHYLRVNFRQNPTVGCGMSGRHPLQGKGHIRVLRGSAQTINSVRNLFTFTFYFLLRLRLSPTYKGRYTSATELFTWNKFCAEPLHFYFLLLALPAAVPCK